MTVAANDARVTRSQVLDELRAADKLLLISHENPDGDALGSLIAMREILTGLGKDALMFMAADDLPLPHEYRFLSLDGLVTAPPEDVGERTMVFLDCGNIERNPAEGLKREDAHILNLDHHHDNTCFGTVNHVVPDASCTAEIVWRLMRDLEVAPTITIAEALYVGLITDTGKFMYENTGAGAHLMAADLIEAGVDVDGIYRRLYEGVPYGKLELLARGLSHAQRYDGGRLTLTFLSRADYRDSDAEENYSEGVIDHLRAIEGTAVAALVRDRLGDACEGVRKVSLRATDDRVDVSAIARVQGGGGHRRAAGFSTALSPAELVAVLRDAVAEQLG